MTRSPCCHPTMFPNNSSVWCTQFEAAGKRTWVCNAMQEAELQILLHWSILIICTCLICCRREVKFQLSVCAGQTPKPRPSYHWTPKVSSSLYTQKKVTPPPPGTSWPPGHWTYVQKSPSASRFSFTLSHNHGRCRSPAAMCMNWTAM